MCNVTSKATCLHVHPLRLHSSMMRVQSEGILQREKERDVVMSLPSSEHSIELSFGGLGIDVSINMQSKQQKKQ